MWKHRNIHHFLIIKRNPYEIFEPISKGARDFSCGIVIQSLRIKKKREGGRNPVWVHQDQPKENRKMTKNKRT